MPKPILSNRFDCPYATEARCQEAGWRFEKGMQTMDGKRADLLARAREPVRSRRHRPHFRGERQQDVVEAMIDELVSFGTFLKLPFIGNDLVEPLTTDLRWAAAAAGLDAIPRERGPFTARRPRRRGELIGGER